MGLLLGIDGKKRAVNINAGVSVSAITTLYVGLLQSAPAGMDGMDLATLVGAGQGNEFTIGATFYASPGRKAITMGTVAADASGAIIYNNNVSPVEWTNTTGSTVNIAGIFITDAASGTSGQVLWVGTPDAGTASIGNTLKASIAANDLILKVD